MDLQIIIVVVAQGEKVIFHLLFHRRSQTTTLAIIGQEQQEFKGHNVPSLDPDPTLVLLSFCLFILMPIDFPSCFPFFILSHLYALIFQENKYILGKYTNYAFSVCRKYVSCFLKKSTSEVLELIRDSIAFTQDRFHNLRGWAMQTDYGYGIEFKEFKKKLPLIVKGYRIIGFKLVLAISTSYFILMHCRKA